MIKAQDWHLQDMVEGGDKAHQPAREAMRGRWKRPFAGLGWYRATKKALAQLPED